MILHKFLSKNLKRKWWTFDAKQCNLKQIPFEASLLRFQLMRSHAFNQIHGNLVVRERQSEGFSEISIEIFGLEPCWPVSVPARHTHTGCISRQFFKLHGALPSELELNRALNFWSLKEKVSRKLIRFELAICAFSIWCLFACCCFSYSCSLKVMNIFCVIYFSFYSFHVALCSRLSRARNCWIWKTHNF